MITLAVSPAIASAQAPPTHFGKAAVAEWTVNNPAGQITITAILSMPQKGPNELTIIVTHPDARFGTWISSTNDFSCKWSMNHASAVANMKFGPRDSPHLISIEWTATSSPSVAHFRGIDWTINTYAIINQPTANAIAQITIDDETGFHPLTYPSTIAAISNTVENLK